MFARFLGARKVSLKSLLQKTFILLTILTLLIILMFFSKTVSSFDTVYYCIYQDDECVEGSNPKKLVRSDVLQIVERVLIGEKNFIGFEDEQSTILQFYVNEIGDVWVEIPAPEKQGAYGKNISNEEMKLIVKDLEEPYSVYKQKLKLEFEAW